MDSSFTIKPRDTISRPAAGRRNTVRTDLSPSQSVNAAQPAAAIDHSALESATRAPVINPQCQQLLQREREERMRRARKDEALMRQRVYGRNSDKAEAQSQDMPRADFEI